MKRFLRRIISGSVSNGSPTNIRHGFDPRVSLAACKKKYMITKIALIYFYEHQKPDSKLYSINDKKYLFNSRFSASSSVNGEGN